MALYMYGILTHKVERELRYWYWPAWRCFNVGIKMWYHPCRFKTGGVLLTFPDKALPTTEDKVLLKFRNLLDKVGIVSKLIPPGVQQHHQQMLAWLQQIFWKQLIGVVNQCSQTRVVSVALLALILPTASKIRFSSIIGQTIKLVSNVCPTEHSAANSSWALAG